MQVIETEIADLKLIAPAVHGDVRGYFKETWNARDFAAAGIDARFVQDNQSRSVQGTLRGLHYQVQQAQGKLVRVLSGEVFDVAVDLRRSSPTFGRWVGRVLSADDHAMFWIPAGFAHGFYVLSATADLFYKCTDYYAPQHERSLLWNDAQLGIRWPLVGGAAPILSAKDRAGVAFADAEYFP